LKEKNTDGLGMQLSQHPTTDSSVRLESHHLTNQPINQPINQSTHLSWR
jgi:hypothetical protein